MEKREAMLTFRKRHENIDWFLTFQLSGSVLSGLNYSSEVGFLEIILFVSYRY